MKIENQVCTLEQAKRLMELGVEQTGYFSHQHYPETDYRKEAQEVITPRSKEGITDPGEWFSAFTVAELGAMLPQTDVMFVNSYWDDHGGTWNCQFKQWKDENNREDVRTANETEGETEAEARAEMLIWMLENKYVTPEEVNSLLNSEVL